ncbi:hypothetical protein [Cellulomonas sp. Marseille-Q8402]
MARSRTSARRPVVVGAIALAAAAVLSGCSATNQITTEMAYAASDGVRASLGDLTAENLLLLAAAADEPGALQGALTNRGDDALTVEVATEASSERVRVAAGETVLLGGTEGEEILLETPGAPGSTVALTLSTDAAGTETLQVPVLDGTLPEYAGLVPEEVLPSATPTEEATEPAVEETTEATEPTGTETEDAEQAGGNEG